MPNNDQGTPPTNPWELILGRFDDLKEDVSDFRDDVKDVLQRLVKVEQKIAGLLWVVGIIGLIVGNMAPKVWDVINPVKQAQAIERIGK
jgi:hypothetical protein